MVQTKTLEMKEFRLSTLTDRQVKEIVENYLQTAKCETPALVIVTDGKNLKVRVLKKTCPANKELDEPSIE